jgi:hypothetical protein
MQLSACLSCWLFSLADRLAVELSCCAIVIAQLKVLLPSLLYLPEGHSLQAERVTTAEGTLSAVTEFAFSPMESSGTSVLEVILTEPPISKKVTWDGLKCRELNVVVVRAYLPDDYDRSRERLTEHRELLRSLENVAAGVIRRIRTVLQVEGLSEEALADAKKSLDFLNDSGAEFERDPTKIRGIASHGFQFQAKCCPQRYVNG